MQNLDIFAIQGQLHACSAAIVDIDRTNDVACFRAPRVKPAVFVDEIDPRQAKAHNPLLESRR